MVPQGQTGACNRRAQGFTASGYVADISNFHGRQGLFDALMNRRDSVDIVLNNVGTNIRKQTVGHSEIEYDIIISANMHATFDVCRRA